MPDRLNPADATAAESDYQKKFNRKAKDEAAHNAKTVKEQEAATDTTWKTTTKKKAADDGKKARFRFAGKRAGRVRQGSVFAFIFVMLGLGVWYTSVFAPNILLVNIKEMYTNDLSDTTIALDTYYKGLMAYKINRSNCGDKTSIKCKLSTMSRAQKLAFEKQGFTVIGSKLSEDNLDDGEPGNNLSEQRYQVSAILPPAYTDILNGLVARGMSVPSNLLGTNLDQLGDRVNSEVSALIKEQTQKLSNPLQYTPIVQGDMLFLYASLSDGNKAQVYNVFNPKSSFFMDARFKQRIKAKYNLTKNVTTVGNTEQAVNNSFNKSVQSGGGIDTNGRPDSSNGVSLGALSSPVVLAQIQLAAQTMSLQANSYPELQCAWYTLGKAVTNDAKSAKAATLARFAMQYLKAADSIKTGQADVVSTNVLSSKLAESSFGGYNGANALDSSLYKVVTYGTGDNSLGIPEMIAKLALLNASPYSLNPFDIYGFLIPAWSQIMVSAAAVGTAAGVSGRLIMPPGNLAGGDRDYCLDGQTLTNKTAIKNDKCATAITASAPPGMEAAVSGALKVGDETCPQPHVEAGEGGIRYKGQFITAPSLAVTNESLTAYVAGLFGINVMAWANAESLLFTSSTKGTAASDAIFAGTGELLGDMAMSRGMMPSNQAYMAEYLAQGESIEKDYDDVARYNAKQNPFDAYNKFSFLGSIVGSLSPSYSSDTPLLASLSNAFSLLGSSVKQLDSSAKAFYNIQPQIRPIDLTNPVTAGIHASDLAKYVAGRFTCADPEYIAIGIVADAACNVRYSMSRLDLAEALNIDGVLDYMTQTHSDKYQSQLDELNQRLVTADTEGPAGGEKANILRQIAQVQSAKDKGFIDNSGKATRYSEYEKYLDYCVNRQDPWGRSAMAVHRERLSDQQIKDIQKNQTSDGEAIDPTGAGDPYATTSTGAYLAITEGSKSDQDWYTGKKCTDESDDMVRKFRAYTMLCSIDGSLAGSVDCSYADNSFGAAYSNPFYTTNDILYTSW